MGLSFLKYMNMRKIILLICILSVFITCNFYKKSNKLDIQISVKEKLSSNKFKHERGTFYSINIDLYNNTDTTISFWVISCPFWENLILKEAQKQGMLTMEQSGILKVLKGETTIEEITRVTGKSGE